MAEFIARGTGQAVLVRTPQPDALARAVTAAGGTRDPDRRGRPGGARPAGGAGPGGDLALASGIAVHHLAPARASLEEAFMELTAGSVEYQAGAARPWPAGPARSGGMTWQPSRPAGPALAPCPARGRRAGLAGTLRSEFTKLRSVRSTYWSLLLLVLAGIAWSVANCAGVAAHWAQTPPAQRGLLRRDPGQRGRAGPARPARRRGAGRARDHLGVLDRDDPHLADRACRGGAWYSRPRPSCSPRSPWSSRRLTSFAAFFIGQYLLRSTHAGATLGQPNVLRAVLATALYVTLSGLFSFGLGAMLRSTAGALTAAYGLLFLRAAAGQGAAQQLVRGPGPVAAGRRRHQRDHQYPAPAPPSICSPPGESSRCSAATRPSSSSSGALLLRHRDA